MPASVGCGSAQLAENLAPLSGSLRSTRRVNGKAAIAWRRAADILGFSNGSPKQNTIRSAEATAELSHRHSSSGCATTTAIGEGGSEGATERQAPLFSVRQDRVIEFLKRFGLSADIESPFDEGASLGAHAQPG